MMRIKKIKETCLYVENLDQIGQFYKDVLGFEMISKAPDRHIFFRVGESVLLCFNPEATKKEESLPPHFAKGPQHIAFEVEKEFYEDTRAALIGKGVKISHEEHWSQTVSSFYFDDPSGNVLEIVTPELWD